MHARPWQLVAAAGSPIRLGEVGGGTYTSQGHGGPVGCKWLRHALSTWCGVVPASCSYAVMRSWFGAAARGGMSAACCHPPPCPAPAPAGLPLRAGRRPPATDSVRRVRLCLWPGAPQPGAPARQAHGAHVRWAAMRQHGMACAAVAASTALLAHPPPRTHCSGLVLLSQAARASRLRMSCLHAQPGWSVNYAVIV